MPVCKKCGEQLTDDNWADSTKLLNVVIRYDRGLTYTDFVLSDSVGE